MTIGLMFSGQGVQKVGMGHSLYESKVKAKAFFDHANAILGFDLKQACFQGPEETLTQTRYCQPALYVHGYVVYELLKEADLLAELKIVFGLSLGEVTACAAAGVFDFETGLRIVAERGRLMQEACEATEGAMASIIGGSKDAVEQLCQEADVDMANVNCPGQIVISGEKSKIKAAIEKAGAMGFKRVIPLNVAGAYHSRLMQGASEAFGRYLKDIQFDKPCYTVLSNTTGKEIKDSQAIKEALVKQVVSPVLFEDCLMRAAHAGVIKLYECGPGNVLCGLARRTDPNLNVLSIGELKDMPSQVTA